MNNKIKKEKFRGLPIISLVTGILTVVCVNFAFILLSTFGWGLADGSQLRILDFVILFGTLSLGFILGIIATTLGSVDLTRIKQNKHSKKGISMDIIGIVMGSIYVLVNIFFLCLALLMFTNVLDFIFV